MGIVIEQDFRTNGKKILRSFVEHVKMIVSQRVRIIIEHDEPVAGGDFRPRISPCRPRIVFETQQTHRKVVGKFLRAYRRGRRIVVHDDDFSAAELLMSPARQTSQRFEGFAQGFGPITGRQQIADHGSDSPTSPWVRFQTSVAN